jgi:hypothetical protein
MSIEKHYSITFIASLALREKQIQQNYRPIIAVHKWFARRPGTLCRGLLLSEFGNRPVEETYYHYQAFLIGIALPALFLQKLGKAPALTNLQLLEEAFGELPSDTPLLKILKIEASSNSSFAAHHPYSQGHYCSYHYYRYDH